MFRETLVLIFLGPPGAGKGTHALPLSEKLQVPHISTGALFRELIRKRTPLGIIAEKYMNGGRLLPDEIAMQAVLERTSQLDCSKGYILDGFPRTIQQAKELKKYLESSQLIALNFEISESLLIERISGRLACKSCTRSYHKIYNPPKRKDLCDGCQEGLYVREDDREEVLRKRLEVYNTQTAPLIEFYEEVLVRIDGEQAKSQVFEQVLQAAQLHFSKL